MVYFCKWFNIRNKILFTYEEFMNYRIPLDTISVISWLSFVGGGNMSSHCLFHSYSGLGLWCLSPLSTIFQLYHGSFIGGGNHRVPVENDQPVTSLLPTLSHIVVSSTPQVEKQNPQKNTTNIWWAMKTPGSLLLYGLVTFYPETWKFLARLNLAMFSL